MLQNPRHYPWGHTPSLASGSLTGATPLTGAGLPGGVPINAGGASPATTGRHGWPAPRRGLWRMRCSTRSGRFNPF